MADKTQTFDSTGRRTTRFYFLLSYKMEGVGVWHTLTHTITITSPIFSYISLEILIGVEKLEEKESWLRVSRSPPPGGGRGAVGSTHPTGRSCWTDGANVALTCPAAHDRRSSVAGSRTSLDLDKPTASHHTSLTLTTVCLVWTVGYGNLLDFYSSNWLSGPNMWREEVVLSSLLG